MRPLWRGEEGADWKNGTCRGARLERREIREIAEVERHVCLVEVARVHGHGGEVGARALHGGDRTL
jgi:hypothetical protein